MQISLQTVLENFAKAAAASTLQTLEQAGVQVVGLTSQQIAGSSLQGTLGQLMLPQTQAQQAAARLLGTVEPQSAQPQSREGAFAIKLVSGSDGRAVDAFAYRKKSANGRDSFYTEIKGKDCAITHVKADMWRLRAKPTVDVSNHEWTEQELRFLSALDVKEARMMGDIAKAVGVEKHAMLLPTLRVCQNAGFCVSVKTNKSKNGGIKLTKNGAAFLSGKGRKQIQVQQTSPELEPAAVGANGATYAEDSP